MVLLKKTFPGQMEEISSITVGSFSGLTSTGKLNFPRISTLLLSSATTIIDFDRLATIFSLVRAPPPPLIREKWLSNSSAPSIVMSNDLTSEISISGIPRLSASSLVASLVGTPIISSPSSDTLLPISIIVYLTVEPVPSPTFIPLFT